MARPSPGTQRVLAILNLLANNPAKAFSLTELINGLKMNRATCHSLVSELVSAGYLYRTRDKLYVLGPAAAELGHAAQLHATPLQIALPEMTALANRHDLVCTAIFHEGADAVVRQWTVAYSHLDWAVNRVERQPLRPPFGGVFLVSSTEKQIESWFDSLDPPVSPVQKEETRASIDFVRRHGFQFVIRNRSESEEINSLDWIFLQDPAERPLQVARHIEESALYGITSMSSPVFDRQDRVAFVLNLRGFSGSFAGSDILAIGNELRAACQKVTSFSRL